MDVEFLIKRLERYIFEESPRIPLSNNRAVNEEDIRKQLELIQESLPKDLAMAREIVQQRTAVIEGARQEAARILAEAQAEAARLIEAHRITQEAREQAARIRASAEKDAEQLKRDADEYVFNMLSQLQEELLRLQRVVDNGLQKLQADREPPLTPPQG